MISKTVEYALRAVVWLAGKPDTPQTTRQIAGGTRVPVGYLSKVLQTLTQAGLLYSQRGLGGGFILARPPSRITVLDVINAVDRIERIRRCPLDLRAHARQLCSLHRRLDAALAMIEETFGSCTIADLLHEAGSQVPLCVVPKSKPVAGNLAARVRGR